MKNLKLFRRAIQSLVVFGVFWLEKLVEYHLLEGKKSPPALVWIVAAVGLVALLYAVEWGINTWFDHSEWMREAILQDDFIEGVWFNKVKASGTALYGLLYIKVKEDSAVVHGTQYDEQGSLTGTWDSYMAEYHGNTLKYAYHVMYINQPERQGVRGVSDISFSKTVGMPKEYAGWFQDICPHQQTATTFTFVGRRVTKQPQLGMLAGSEKDRAVKELIAEHANL